ncbi:MAG: polysaccharide biosynthesis/export family protein [Prevotella sp.]|nr:polysaccharide biosynthesis/export family protein [Prevotella sp.]
MLIPIKFRYDKISVFVKSKDELLTESFNISLPNMQQVLGYTIENDGTIDFPMLGRISLDGLPRSGAAAAIKHQIITKFGDRDAIVTIDFLNLHFSVLGEVKEPGYYEITQDQVSIFDALGKAGDMTIYGVRDSVKVIRSENGKKHIYTLNMKSGASMMQSPAFYLQQNDVVYVPANNMRQRESTVNGNTFRSTSFWISFASLLTTVSVLIFK